MKLDILYFAWVRERVGHSQETYETSAATVADLIAELVARDAGYAAAFAGNLLGDTYSSKQTETDGRRQGGGCCRRRCA